MKIAMLPGDGIGTEIVAEAAKVLERLRCDGLPIETETAPIASRLDARHRAAR
jgi:3-isopropylmalate dehydrogenase